MIGAHMIKMGLPNLPAANVQGFLAFQTNIILSFDRFSRLDYPALII